MVQTFVLEFKLPQTFEEDIAIVLLLYADYFCLPLSLLKGVICFKHTPFLLFKWKHAIQRVQV